MRSPKGPNEGQADEKPAKALSRDLSEIHPYTAESGGDDRELEQEESNRSPNAVGREERHFGEPFVIDPRPIGRELVRIALNGRSRGDDVATKGEVAPEIGIGWSDEGRRGDKEDQRGSNENDRAHSRSPACHAPPASCSSRNCSSISNRVL